MDASILAAESQFGSLNIERTDRRIDSKQIAIKTIVQNLLTHQRIVQVTNVLKHVHNRIDQHQVHEATNNFSHLIIRATIQLTIDIHTSPFFSIFGCQISDINFYKNGHSRLDYRCIEIYHLRWFDWIIFRKI